jgi:3-isopropylmalate/(R)-2-methylmalate dehydratase small subunit
LTSGATWTKASPGQDPSTRKPNPDFVLNQPRYAKALQCCSHARILAAAPAANTRLGRSISTAFAHLIAPSYADIFFNNCFKNGLLPIVLPESLVDQLFNEVAAFAGYELTIDLERQVVVKPQGEEIPFEVQAFRKYCLLNGLDDIGLTLRHAEKIRSFEAERLAKSLGWRTPCQVEPKWSPSCFDKSFCAGSGCVSLGFSAFGLGTLNLFLTLRANLGLIVEHGLMKIAILRADLPADGIGTEIVSAGGRQSGSEAQGAGLEVWKWNPRWSAVPPMRRTATRCPSPP